MRLGPGVKVSFVLVLLCSTAEDGAAGLGAGAFCCRALQCLCVNYGMQTEMHFLLPDAAAAIHREVGSCEWKIALPKCRPLPSSSSADLPFEVDCPGLAGMVSADSLMKATASVSSPVQQPKDVDYELVFEAPAGADQELPEKSGSGAVHPVDPSVVHPFDASPFKPLEKAPSSKVVRFAPEILSDAQSWQFVFAVVWMVLLIECRVSFCCGCSLDKCKGHPWADYVDFKLWLDSEGLMMSDDAAVWLLKLPIALPDWVCGR
ncbi:hypothetical protein Nepgr_021428 [Nepenthes gracilis]|uniref:Uncharacterized protein n=1 Tax=Nepenthes gracilis TaxID=150966 RepID=A0AAD3XVX8_NEPGR|nr:hypothetical protein Nepgr_021428 [Nepenthes gracilis]